MTDTKYNGWTNRETWLVNLWFGDMFSGDDGDDTTFPNHWTAEAIETFIIDQVECTTNQGGFVADMIDISGINYTELENHYKED
jgi:hypothetical protein